LERGACTLAPLSFVYIATMNKENTKALYLI